MSYYDDKTSAGYNESLNNSINLNLNNSFNSLNKLNEISNSDTFKSNMDFINNIKNINKNSNDINNINASKSTNNMNNKFNLINSDKEQNKIKLNSKSAFKPGNPNNIIINNSQDKDNMYSHRLIEELTKNKIEDKIMEVITQVAKNR